MQRLSIGVTEARIVFQNCVAARKSEKLEDLDDVVSPLCSDVECTIWGRTGVPCISQGAWARVTHKSMHEVRSRVKPKPRQILAPYGKPYRTRGGRDYLRSLFLFRAQATKEDVQEAASDTREQIVSELGAMIKALEARLKRMER